MEQWKDGILGPLVLHLVEKYYGSWDLPAIAFGTLPLIWTLFLLKFFEQAITRTGVAGG